jgi:DNA-binding response OmpR family regulator
LSSASSAKEPEPRARWRILVVEDNKADVFLIREAIQLAKVNADLHVVHDGEKAIRYFSELDADQNLPAPALIILDINLPKKHGAEVLDEMRHSRRCANALVLVVTSSDSDKDRDEMAKRGANGYFRKPSSYEDFLKLGGVVSNLLHNEPQEELV